MRDGGRRGGGWRPFVVVLVLLVAASAAWSVRQRTPGEDGGESVLVGDGGAGRGDGGRDGAGHRGGDGQIEAPDARTGKGASEAAPEDVATLGDDGMAISTMEGTVEQVATRLLASYRDAGDCVLADAGYLDLLGSVWGCVVRGDGWVDVCAVFEREEASCAVRVFRLDADDVEGLLAGEDGEL